ncbi:hypothetical protein AKJ57_06405 [candidate division MSBL1 archaeon SCGC-AAA259A05]|uniref:Xylose isomerase-like TIM barrel domain-containing protein n=1 Tax=candidate division MSBL1 archaeon SCGC-AAA259A05 TaxID=1698259 RepID=A0A133U3H3_9EURY|nr:hypothetical protein AKJ57_06405 [candidate division MSBL1 archaeon SCGC-AAA259A05]
MKIGLSVAILWDYKELDIPKAISHSVDNLNYEAVEIHCEEPFFKGWGTEGGHETREKIKDALSVVDADVSLHAPYHDTNIATMSSGIGKEIIRQHKECIETARYLDSEILVVHPGFVSSRKYERKISLQKMTENLKKITKFAGENGVKICLENLSSKRKAMCTDTAEIKKTLKKVNMEDLKVTFDIAHANTTEEGPLKFARRLKEHIAHVHVSDNTGEDNHLPMGLGNIDFEAVFEELNPFDGFSVVEGWIPRDEDPFLIYDREELEKIRKKLRN